MKHDPHMTSRMLASAGALMAISGLLMALCVKLAYGGMLLAAALCMFFAAHSFRIAENSPVGDGPGAAAARSKRRHRLTVRKGGFLLHSSGRTGKGVCEPTAIVYTSSTGCTRQYALLLGTRTGLPVYALDETCWSCCSTAAAGAAKRTWPWLRTGTGAAMMGPIFCCAPARSVFLRAALFCLKNIEKCEKNKSLH